MLIEENRKATKTKKWKSPENRIRSLEADSRPTPIWMVTWNLIVMACETTGERKHSLKYSTERLPGGLVVKNPPCNAGNSGQRTETPHDERQPESMCHNWRAWASQRKILPVETKSKHSQINTEKYLRVRMYY